MSKGKYTRSSLLNADNYRRALEAYVQCRERALAKEFYDPESDH